MKKIYTSPDFDKISVSCEDILQGSGEVSENENLFDTSVLF